MRRNLRWVIHLERRFFRALSDRPPTPDEQAWALSFLTPAERDLWTRMQNQDRRHCIEVAQRLERFLPNPPARATTAALLHDVGKVESHLNTFERVLATLVGSPTKRFRSYHDHERIGADMLRAAGSDPEVVALVSETSTDEVVSNALRLADNI